MKEQHLFVYDAKQTKDAHAPGADIVLYCGCGLPQHNQHHLNGFAAVDELLQAKWQRHQEDRADLTALAKQAMKLYYAENYPTAHFITYRVDEAFVSLEKLHDSEGWLIAGEGEADEPGWLFSIAEVTDDIGDDVSITRDLATWTVVDNATYDILKQEKRPSK